MDFSKALQSLKEAHEVELSSKSFSSLSLLAHSNGRFSNLPEVESYNKVKCSHFRSRDYLTA